jgi:glycogen(starch) synthase
MRILMLSWEYPPRIVGGISRVVHDLAQKLGEDGNEVHVVTFWEENTTQFVKDKSVFVHRVQTYRIEANNFIDWVMHLNFAILEHSIKMISELGNFDIIHAHDWIVAYAARVLKSSFSIPLVSTIHATECGRNGGIHTDMQKYISGIEWWLTYESWKVIVNSDFMKNEVKGIFQLPEDKICVIPNGVDINKFKGFDIDDNFRASFARENEKIVFFVGRLVNEKGAQVLLDAVPKIVSHYNDVKFVIAGKGPQMDYLREKATNLNISPKVHFTGYISDEDLSRLYKCSDIAVFPSLYEPFGIVALEAMIANIPVVVSDTGGLGEIINHGIDGMKSYAGNANSLADSILELLLNPDKAKEITKNAIEKVIKIYNWEIISKHTGEIYERVVRESNNRHWGLQPLNELITEL